MSYIAELIDKSDGENQAVRMFLMYYGGNTGCTITGMKHNLKQAGFDKLWPEWAETRVGHLTKSGAQDWLRYLFNKEQE